MNPDLDTIRINADQAARGDKFWPQWFYMEEREGLTGLEVGCLMTMDRHPDRPFEKDRKGNWYYADARRLEDGCHDLAWSTQIINRLLKKGWVIEEGTYDEGGRPLRVWRSAKPAKLLLDERDVHPVPGY